MILAAWLFGVGGVVLAGIGIFFILARPALLPEDLLFLQQHADDIDAAVPRLRRWLRLVFVVLGGHATAGGILTVFLAATSVRHNDVAAVVALGVAGSVSVGLMTGVNFALKSDFRWMLFGVSGIWLAGTLAATLA